MARPGDRRQGKGAAPHCRGEPRRPFRDIPIIPYRMDPEIDAPLLPARGRRIGIPSVGAVRLRRLGGVGPSGPRATGGPVEASRRTRGHCAGLGRRVTCRARSSRHRAATFLPGPRLICRDGRTASDRSPAGPVTCRPGRPGTGRSLCRPGSSGDLPRSVVLPRPITRRRSDQYDA